MKTLISESQIQDATGAFGESARTEGALFVRPSDKLASPSFEEARMLLQPDAPANIGMLALKNIANLPFNKLNGLRVIVPVVDGKGKGRFLPGVVAETDRNTTVFACLSSGNDARSKETVKKPLSDIQIFLLGKLASEHRSSLGAHANDGRINSGDIAHAVLVAGSVSPNGIHQSVHDLVSSRSFSAGTINMATIYSENGKRSNESRDILLSSARGVLILESHQTPWLRNGDPFELSAGVVHAVQGMITEGPKPDINANLASLLQ